jgi:hypothetical protein
VIVAKITVGGMRLDYVFICRNDTRNLTVRENQGQGLGMNSKGDVE